MKNTLESACAVRFFPPGSNTFSSFRRFAFHLGVLFAITWAGLPVPALAAEAAGEKKVVGYVFEARGKWLQNDQVVEQGAGVFAGARITLSPANAVEKPAIVVHLVDGGREMRSATVPGSLKKPIEIPENLGDNDSRLARVMKAVQAVFVKEPERYLPTMTREGGDAAVLQESIVKSAADGSADLSPAFGTVPAGKFLLRWRQLKVDERVPASSPSRSTVASAPVTWNPESPASAVIAGLAPGLYRVSLLSASEEQPLGAPAWILVCTPGDYQSAAEGFRDALEMTRQWGQEAKPDEVRALLRAYLESLVGKQGEVVP
jgi:hypothetical protein